MDEWPPNEVDLDADVAELPKWEFSMFETARFVETLDEEPREVAEIEPAVPRLLVAAESDVELCAPAEFAEFVAGEVPREFA